MKDAVLTHEQTWKLLEALATDDIFRAQYQEKPAVALANLGIPAETIVNLHYRCLAPVRIGPKEAFQAALQKLTDEAVQRFGSMHIPSAKFGHAATRKYVA